MVVRHDITTKMQVFHGTSLKENAHADQHASAEEMEEHCERKSIKGRLDGSHCQTIAVQICECRPALVVRKHEADTL